MKVLVTGGAGYIGSYTCLELLTNAHEVFVVDDLCNEHINAFHFQQNLEPFGVLNIGNVQGTVVLELINSFQQVSGTSVKYKLYSRHNGDLPAFWANSSFAFENLAWKPQFTIDQMCEDTWRWQINNITDYDVDKSNDAKTSHVNPKDKLDAKN